jgi:Ser/Thr protein kinase RdoA (MazF antagonist)
LTARPLDAWWTNLVLLIEADSERLVLRRYGTTPAEEVAWEIALLEHLRRHDFPVIRPLLSEAGAALSAFLGGPAIVYPYIKGEALPKDSPLRPKAAVDAAALIGRLGAVSQGVVLPHPRVRSGTSSARMLANALNWSEERGIRSGESVLRTFLGDVRRELEGMEGWLAPLSAALPAGAVHHDAHPGNVLFRDGRLVALLDFDDAYPGYLVEELPVLLDSWATDWDTPTLLESPACAVLEAYQHERPLAPVEMEVLPYFHLAYLLGDAAAGLLAWAGRGRPPEDFVIQSEGYRRYQAFRSERAWRDVLRRASGGRR